MPIGTHTLLLRKRGWATRCWAFGREPSLDGGFVVLELDGGLGVLWEELLAVSWKDTKHKNKNAIECTRADTQMEL